MLAYDAGARNAEESWRRSADRQHRASRRSMLLLGSVGTRAVYEERSSNKHTARPGMMRKQIMSVLDARSLHTARFCARGCAVCFPGERAHARERGRPARARGRARETTSQRRRSELVEREAPRGDTRERRRKKRPRRSLKNNLGVTDGFGSEVQRGDLKQASFDTELICIPCAIHRIVCGGAC